MDRRNFMGAGFYAALLGDARAAGTSRAPRLKIREVRAIRLKNGFNSRFVRVYTEEGLTGTGECVDSVGTEYIINHNFNVMLKGRDPLDIQGILADFWGYHKVNLGGAPSVMFVHGQGGPYLTAVSGVEMALWDLAGKAFGLPIHHLMGGKMRDRVPVYLHAANPAIARKVLDQTKTKVLKVGLDYSDDSWSIKKGYEPTRPYHLHMTNNQVDDVVNFFAGFRKELGKDVEIGLECHAHYDTETGIQICNQIEPYRPLWVEEPVPSDNVESMLRIRNNTRVPIAAGENIYARYGFRPYLEKQALSILQPDLTKTGGLMEGLKIAAMAETYHKPFAPHDCVGPVGFIAGIHASFSQPNTLIQESVRAFYTGWYNELVTTMPVIRDGYVLPMEGPGLGTELLPAVFERSDLITRRSEA